YYCYLCEEAGKESPKIKVLPSKGTDPCLTHLEIKHKIDRHTGLKITSTDKPPSTSTSNIGSLFRRASTIIKAQFEKFKRLLVRWIVYYHIAFAQIKNVYFQQLLFHF
ncbi:hypothetical protein GQ44DRAFT_808474, partial [Phaeosphaeriaceae sp. PMI808]